MQALIAQAKVLFHKHFQGEPAAIIQAPGRVNLIGEHTDYNGGWVMPCAIDRQTVIAVRPREDKNFRVIAGNFGEAGSDWQSQLPIPPDEHARWANYLRGVNEQFEKHHEVNRGLDVAVIGNIPHGAGLSSSASFSVAFALAINVFNELKLDSKAIARLCQSAENEYFGCQCGIMDQLISVAGREGHALLIDCDSLALQPIPIPSDLNVVIVDSKVSRGLVDSAYDERRRQCEAAAKTLGVPLLAQASLADLETHRSQMDAVEYRRARHVISEHQRTAAAADALLKSDYRALSRHMADSHQSMRDDFEITTWQLDELVAIISHVVKDSGGARMTGGGFGGCVVALVPIELTESVVQTVMQTYPAKTGLQPEIHICHASEGAGII